MSGTSLLAPPEVRRYSTVVFYTNPATESTDVHSQRLTLVGGATSVLVVVALVVLADVFRNPDVWLAVGAVYALVLLLAAGARFWRDRPLGFSETVAVAAVAVVALAPLTPRLFVVGDSLFPGSWVVPAHLQRFVPVAFMLPLGAATTRRQRLGVVAVVLLPSLYEVAEPFVLQPGRVGSFASPLGVVVSTVGWLVFLVAAGGPLFVLGRQLAREDGPLQQVARRRGAPGAE